MDDKNNGLVNDGRTLIASLDEEIEANREDEEIRASKKGRWKVFVWIGGILVASLLIAWVGLTFAFDYLGMSKTGETEVLIEKGANTAKIADALGENDVIRSPLMFRIYAKLRGYESKFQYGLYVLSGDMGYDKIAEVLMTEGEQAKAVKVTVREGSSIDDIAALLEEKGICTRDEFIREIDKGEFNYGFIKDIPEGVHYRLEGYLYSDTYEFFDYGGEECAHRAIDKMLANFNTKIATGEVGEMIKSSGKSLHEIMTMASIVQLEAGGAKQEDRQKVAAVFYNRLAWTAEPNLLGSTPTAEYPYGDGAYDTNKSRGLPPGPLCTAEAEVVKATLTPAEGFAACYFVTDKDNVFYYNETYRDHLATINDLKSKGLWK